VTPEFAAQNTIYFTKTFETKHQKACESFPKAANLGNVFPMEYMELRDAGQTIVLAEWKLQILGEVEGDGFEIERSCLDLGFYVELVL